MSSFSTTNYTTTGSKTAISLDEEKTTVIGVNGGDSDFYDIEILLSATGTRFPLTQGANGQTILTLPHPADRVGLNITAIPSGSIDLEIFQEINISQSIAVEG